MSRPVIVVDDERLARANLESILAQREDWNVVASVSSGKEALERLGECHADLAFLDIQMPCMSGIELAAEINARFPQTVVVFVTAHDRFAIDAFDVLALDYVLKPYEDSRIDRALQRAAQRLQHTVVDDCGTELQQLLSDERTSRESGVAPPAHFFTIRSIGSVERVRVEHILWVRSAGNYVELHVPGRMHLLRAPISTVDRRLPEAEFLRVHRTAIVRRSEISRLVTLGDGAYELALVGGERVPVSAKHVTCVRDELAAG